MDPYIALQLPDASLFFMQADGSFTPEIWPPHCPSSAIYLATITGHGVARLLTPLAIELFLWALPGIGLGIYLGGKVHHMIPKPVFSRVIFGLLVVIGMLSWLSRTPL